MTEKRMALIDLVEKKADGDLVHEMLAFAAERIMEFDRKAIDPGDRLQGECDRGTNRRGQGRALADAGGATEWIP